MSDEHGDGFVRGRAGSQKLSNAPENDDFPTRVELPDHASAYFSPKPLPAVSNHRTLETAPVRLHPSLDFDGADTQRLPVPPFLQDTVDRNAPTVLVRAIPWRRRCSRAVIGAVGIGAVCLGGALVWALFGSAPDAVTDTGAAKANASMRPVSSAPRLAVAKAAPAPSRVTAAPEATSGSVASGVTASARSPAPSNATSATSTSPARTKPVGQPARSAAPANAPVARTAPATTATPEEAQPQREPPKVSTPPAPTSPEPAPKSWVSDEAPKSWVR